MNMCPISNSFNSKNENWIMNLKETPGVSKCQMGRARCSGLTVSGMMSRQGMTETQEESPALEPLSTIVTLVKHYSSNVLWSIELEGW